MATLPSVVVSQLQNWQAHYTQKFGVNGETGVDIGLPYHTPVYSITDGVVLGVGYYGGGGVASVRSTLNYAGLGDASVYYQHLSEYVVQQGQRVYPGTLVGYSGGQLGYGLHPSSPQFSTGEHIEVGINAPYGGMWHPLGPNINPIPWMNYLLQNGYIPWTGGGTVISNPGTVLGGSVAGAIGSADVNPWNDPGVNAIFAFATRHVNHTQNDDFYSLALQLDDAESFPPLSSLTAAPNNWSTNIPIIGGPIGGIEGLVSAPFRIFGYLMSCLEAIAIRGAIFSIGGILILIVAVRIMSNHGDEIQQRAQSIAPIIVAAS